MYKMNMCPMMKQQADYMHTHGMMQTPGMMQTAGMTHTPCMHKMPMQMSIEEDDMIMPMQHMPMMHMNCEMENDMKHFEEDEKDDILMLDMYPQMCKKMLPHINKVLDKMEDKDEAILVIYMDKGMVNSMIEDAYEEVVKHMPEKEHRYEDERQYGPNPYLKDLVGILLLSELARRRRRRRRFPYYGYSHHNYGGWGGNYYGRGDREDYFDHFDYKDFYYDMD